jgi:hypothetical protein
MSVDIAVISLATPTLTHWTGSVLCRRRFSDRNGTTVSEQGRLLNTNDDWEAVIVKEGSYSYVSPEGTRITVNYVADEKGFRATGDHIPTPSGQQ